MWFYCLRKLLSSLMLFVLLFIISPNLTASPFAWSLSSANTVGCRSFATCTAPAVSVGGRISALHHQRVQAQLTDQEKLMQNLLMLRGRQSLQCQTVSVLLACQLNREKTTSLKLIVPPLATIGCQGAKWIRHTPQTEVWKSLSGALNSHHSHTGAAVTTWQ